jgi:hypothetical protein
MAEAIAGRDAGRLLKKIVATVLFGLGMSVPAVAQMTVSDAPSAQPTTTTPGSFWGRLALFYHQDWTGTTPSSPPAPRRGLSSPLDSPPFPSADWSYGGSPTIGEADGNSYPLMTAIDGASSRTKVYGWIAPDVNGSTSGHSNLPLGDDDYANRVELGQAVLYVERLPDSVQRTHVDVGFHLTAYYGTDYQFTTNKGYFSSQYIVHKHQYGFDPLLEYVDVYVPQVASGMNLRVGRFTSIAGIESQLTVTDYTYSQSLLYVIDPGTDTGVLATIKLNDRWVVQTGISSGHDVAPWTSDAKLSAMDCVSYTTKSVIDNYYVCANGINDGKYAYNNLQQYDATWYYKFSPRWHTATEAYVMYQRDVPSVTGPIEPEPNTYGALCRPGQPTCFAPEWAIDNYINRELNTHNSLSFRSDFLNDKKGQRTGTATKYTENTLSLTHWIGTTIQIRPEIRFDHSWDRFGYDDGKKQSQFTAASDLIFHF